MKRLFLKIPVSAKRVASGGMIRGMFRYDSPSLVYCLHKYTLASPAKRGLGMIRGMYRVWFGVWFGCATVSGKIRKIEMCQIINTFKTLHILCTKSFWWHCLTQKLDAGFDSNWTRSSRLANSIKTNGCFKTWLKMIRGHDSGYDSRKCTKHVVIIFVKALFQRSSQTASKERLR